MGEADVNVKCRVSGALWNSSSTTLLAVSWHWHTSNQPSVLSPRRAPRLPRHNETKVWKAYRVVPQVSRPSDARLVSNANTDRVSWDSLRNSDPPMSPAAGHVTFASPSCCSTLYCFLYRCVRHSPWLRFSSFCLLSPLALVIVSVAVLLFLDGRRCGTHLEMLKLNCGYVFFILNFYNISQVFSFSFVFPIIVSQDLKKKNVTRGLKHNASHTWLFYKYVYFCLKIRFFWQSIAQKIIIRK